MQGSVTVPQPTSVGKGPPVDRVQWRKQHLVIPGSTSLFKIMHQYSCMLPDAPDDLLNWPVTLMRLNRGVVSGHINAEIAEGFQKPGLHCKSGGFIVTSKPEGPVA